MKTLFLKKNCGYNRATVIPIIQKILVYSMKFCYKNISEIRNVIFVFQNFQSFWKTKKIFFLIHMKSEKSINLFEWKKKIYSKEKKEKKQIYGTIIIFLFY